MATTKIRFDARLAMFKKNIYFMQTFKVSLYWWMITVQNCTSRHTSVIAFERKSEYDFRTLAHDAVLND
jgi:hypothetical protein